MILQKILRDTRLELEKIKRFLPLKELEKAMSEQPPPLDLTSVLQGGGVKLIAEIKKASPSRGVIRYDFDPLKIARTYAFNGATAISVLTEMKYFQGSLDYLKIIKEGLSDKKIPLLRKDFILEPYQVYQSRAYGADSILLIVAVLKTEELKELVFLSHSLGMKCLVEVHHESELRIAVESGAEIIGINNRNLKTFEIDLTITKRLKPLIPSERIVVSESGIKNRDDILKLRRWGVNAVLVGETLIEAPSIATKMRELL